MQLSGPWFASFSDCNEMVEFNPGIIARLAERTGEEELLNVLARPATPGGDWRLTMMIRNMLWWDGRQPDSAVVGDAALPAAGVARLVSATPVGMPIVLAIKAGHNGENHNQNDIGSFILHVAGENLLTDPGRGLYSRAYFGEQRQIRLRPSYFPFVEPGAEVDVSCFICGGRGCRTCRGEGWIELLGAGMVHPNVLRAGGYDPDEVSGFAAGSGVERPFMLRSGLADLRTLSDNDVRWLTSV